MLYDTIQKDLLQNMKSGNKFDLNVLRMLKSALQMEKINKQNDLSDNEIVNVIKKQVKQRKDSILEFAKYNREDEVANLNKEIELLQQQLEQIKIEKKVMMQLLLTGIVRVNQKGGE